MNRHVVVVLATTRPAHCDCRIVVRQDNRTKYLVYAYEGTARHDTFLDRLFTLIPASGSTRAQIREKV